jgi:Bacterial regulatory proteins, luxR family
MVATLFITPKTVEFHLTRVYRKLEIHSRTELVRRMADDETEVDLLPPRNAESREPDGPLDFDQATRTRTGSAVRRHSAAPGEHRSVGRQQGHGDSLAPHDCTRPGLTGRDA